jgi:peptidoglycan/xylan/chitin deacetylase (PgdA/CDA1 family)
MLAENGLPSSRDSRSARAGINSLFRVTVKKTLGSLARFLPRVRHSIDKGLTVFAFHDVSNRPSQFATRYGLVVSNETFERQIQWIKNNFKVVHPSAILANEPLPKRAAVITFDDGYRGTFENGLPILERLGVPSLIFLNMQPILLGSPVLSAMACFLDGAVPAFADFCRQAGLESPFHLSLNPRAWDEYKREHGDIDMSAVGKYQGEFADRDMLRRWDGHPLVCYGNHLFEHWNAAALSSEELKDQYLRNEAELSSFSGRVNLFAFTNGQPDTCFSTRDVALLESLGAGRVFSTAGGINQDKEEFLLGRVALCESDNTVAGLWFRIGRAVFDERRPEH